MSAVLPSDERATLEPKRTSPTPPLPVSLGPCWLQVEPERVNTHAAPRSSLSVSPPMSAVLPSDERATALPKRPCTPLPPSSAPPRSFSPCWDQVEPERVNTHAAPRCPLAPAPPIRAVWPSDERATLRPKPSSLSSSPEPPVSFSPCWDQVEPERVNTQAAPNPTPPAPVRWSL